MNQSDPIIRSAFASLIALGLAASGSQALAAKGDNEKCAGIVKAGKNDCGTSATSCAGTITRDGHPEAWVYLPKGTCEKIVGAKLVADKGKK
ncbi:MAG: BufA1 family periplasmic bufferin-type metallophore [Burkholderiales bacterium]